MNTRELLEKIEGIAFVGAESEDKGIQKTSLDGIVALIRENVRADENGLIWLDHAHEPRPRKRLNGLTTYIFEVVGSKGKTAKGELFLDTDKSKFFGIVSIDGEIWATTLFKKGKCRARKILERMCFGALHEATRHIKKGE